MKILNIGAMNIDYVYTVDEFVKPGESLKVTSRSVHCGGKGLNQSVAIASAGAQVSHAALMGADGGILLDKMASIGVDTSLIKKVDGVNSHAIIQVDKSGQNCILFYTGDHLLLTPQYIDETLSHFGEGDFITLQNELNDMPLVIRKAKERGMRVAFNPSPLSDDLKHYPLNMVDLLIMNEGEAAAITGTSNPDDITAYMAQHYPAAAILLTIGKRGSIYRFGDISIHAPIIDLPVVDTTGAGDTFTGYFLAMTAQGKSPADAQRYATAAASIAVSRQGAADAIPPLAEVEELLSRVEM